MQHRTNVPREHESYLPEGADSLEQDGEDDAPGEQETERQLPDDVPHVVHPVRRQLHHLAAEKSHKPQPLRPEKVLSSNTLRSLSRAQSHDNPARSSLR